jgi:hypothetical protein
MKYNRNHPSTTGLVIIAVSFILLCQNANAQPGYPHPVYMQPYHSVIVPYPHAHSYRQVPNPVIHTVRAQPFLTFGIHFDPLISWFSTDSYDTRNEGSVPGFNFGMSYNRYFTPNYSFSSGIDIIYAGGRLVSRETSHFELKNYNNDIIIVQQGEAITYRITYLSVPLGFKFQTNTIGYGRFFTDFGFNPKIVIGGKADIPSLNIKGANALPELNPFNLSFHIMMGMEYPLAGNSNVLFGIAFDNNLFDVTKDNGDQPSDIVSQKMVSFRMVFGF